MSEFVNIEGSLWVRRSDVAAVYVDPSRECQLEDRIYLRLRDGGSLELRETDPSRVNKVIKMLDAGPSPDARLLQSRVRDLEAHRDTLLRLIEHDGIVDMLVDDVDRLKYGGRGPGTPQEPSPF